MTPILNPLHGGERPLLVLRRNGCIPFRPLLLYLSLCAFVLLASGLRTGPAFAQGAVSITAGSATVSPGQAASIPITIADVTGRNVTSYSFTLTYDAALLDVTGATVEGTISGEAGLTLVANTNTAGEITIVAAGAEALVGGGTLVVVQFTTLDTEGTSTLQFTEIQFNEGSPAANGVSGQITVVVPNNDLGDVNGDGQLNDTDAERVLRHVSGRVAMDAAQIEKAEVSGDGTVTAWDAVLIRRRAAGRIGCFYVETTCSETPPTHGGPSTVSLNAGRYQISQEAVFIVNLMVESLAATETAAYVLTLTYDPERLTFDGVETNGTLSAGVVADVIAAAGTVTVAAAALDAVESGGNLLRLRFESLPGTGVSDLVLSDVRFNEDEPSVVPVDGKVVVRLLGDTTANGHISALDASVILQYVAGLVELDDVTRAAAEVTGDGTVSAMDATEVLRHVTRLVECLPADAGCTAAKVSEFTW